ncbi:MAG: hypothetical protein KGN16_19240 [Burkholderiales bacterium]|nr:hypothetical protein [Burkholderiales bacterium]
MPDGGHCPSCGLPLKRLHRHPLDRWISVFRSVHRYRCSDPACGWEGVVGREWAGPGMPAHPPWQTRLAWMLAGAALATAGMGVALLVHRAARPAVGPRTPTVAADAVQDLGTGPLAVAAGAYDDGRELLRADPRVGGNPTPLALRHGCVWGVPGRTPYRGSVEQALNATQLLPPEVVQRISQMVEYGWTKDRLEISRKAIRSIDGRHLFRPQIAAMGFGNAMCFDTIVNFPAGHVEYAALYEAEDRSGKTYSVMVPYVCNNVSVLGVRAEITPPGGQMPEPSSWWLVGTALAVLAVRPRRTSGGPA